MRPKEKKKKKLSLICISDTHTMHRKLGEIPMGDVLIHAGDFSSMGLAFETQDFLEWFSSQPHKHKIFISGNHDFLDFDKRERFEEILKQYPKVTYLRDSEVVIKGIKFWGRPWTPAFRDWAFMHGRGSEAMKDSFKIIPNDVDVLITHGPPFGILDATNEGQRVGCDDFLKWMDFHTNPPKVVVMGHIHHSCGMRTVRNTTYINAAVLNDWYRLQESGVKCICFTLEIEDPSPA